mgnify:CR=1 FL=1
MALCPGTQEIFGGLRAAPTSALQDCEEHQMKKHLAHLAAALAVTLLFGAAAGPLSAAAAAPTAAILNEENTAAEDRLPAGQGKQDPVCPCGAQLQDPEALRCGVPAGQDLTFRRDAAPKIPCAILAKQPYLF